MAARALLCSFLALSGAANGITVYNQVGQQAIGTGTVVSTASYAGSTAAAYDALVLEPPALPDPLPANAFSLQLTASASNVNGLSRPVSGDFYGFSIEMSVTTQVSEYLLFLTQSPSKCGPRMLSPFLLHRNLERPHACAAPRDLVYVANVCFRGA